MLRHKMPGARLEVQEIQQLSGALAGNRYGRLIMVEDLEQGRERGIVNFPPGLA